MTTIDPTRSFRNALGSFATGVTVVTTNDSSGNPLGMTVNSFSSVSLEPRMVLWSIDKNSSLVSAFQDAEYYAIHVLHSEQQEISNRFASPIADRFADIHWQPCQHNVPALGEYATRFICQRKYCYEGGDHWILVGEVLEFDHRELPPLLFHGGRYKLLQE